MVKYLNSSTHVWNLSVNLNLFKKVKLQGQGHKCGSHGKVPSLEILMWKYQSSSPHCSKVIRKVQVFKIWVKILGNDFISWCVIVLNCTEHWFTHWLNYVRLIQATCFKSDTKRIVSINKSATTLTCYYLYNHLFKSKNYDGLSFQSHLFLSITFTECHAEWISEVQCKYHLVSNKLYQFWDTLYAWCNLFLKRIHYIFVLSSTHQPTYLSSQ